MNRLNEEIEISIIIPCYNSESYLTTMMNAILKENLDSVEIIIINDGSKDKTLSIAQDYVLENSLKKIKVLNQENKGVSAARNYGIKEASGKYIICFDSDDVIEKNAISVLKEKIISGNDLYAFNFSMFYEEKKIFQKQLHQKTKSYSKKEFLRLFLTRKIHAGVYSLLIKKDFLTKNNLFYKEGQKFGEDYLYIFNLLKSAKLINYDDRIIYHYLVNSSSVSNSKSFSPERIEALYFCEKLLHSDEFCKLKIRNAINFFLADMYCANLQIYAQSKTKDLQAEELLKNFRPLLHHLIFCKPKYWLRIRFFTLLPLQLCKRILEGATK